MTIDFTGTCEICSAPSQFVKVEPMLKREGSVIVQWDQSIELCGGCLKDAIEREESELNQ